MIEEKDGLEGRLTKAKETAIRAIKQASSQSVHPIVAFFVPALNEICRVESLELDLRSLKKTTQTPLASPEAASELSLLRSESAKALARKSSFVLSSLSYDLTKTPLVVESFFDTDEGYNFKLVETRALVHELRDQVTDLTSDCNNSTCVS